MSLHGNALLTRDAEGLFWMARYLERVENIARLVDVTQTFEGPGGRAGSWSALVAINADEPRLKGRRLDAATVKHFYLLDHGNPTSVPASLEFARTNARTLRPLISTEMWMQLNVFHRTVMATRPEDLEGDALSRLCRQIKEGVQAHTGITEGTFARDQGWHFYSLGRQLERADQITRLLDIKYHLLLPGAAEERRLVDPHAVERRVARRGWLSRVPPSGAGRVRAVGRGLVSVVGHDVRAQCRALRARHRLAPSIDYAVTTTSATLRDRWSKWTSFGPHCGPAPASCRRAADCTSSSIGCNGT